VSSLGTGWSAVSYEERDWQFSADLTIPRRQRIAGAGPYGAAVVPKIARTAKLDVASDVLALVSEAATEVARFDSEFGAELVPFASILLRSESVASSKIENLSATAQSIFLAELGDPTRQNASIIVANTTAMTAAIRLADAITADSILAVHHALLQGSQPEWAGKWRDQQVWIGGGDYSPHQALFVPPHHSHVHVLIEDLVDFIRRDDIPPLAHAALAHAQFETIHPFPDGNGRVGRALIHSILKSKELTRNVTVPVSAGLLADLTAYFAALDAYRLGDHEPIITLVANASFRAIGNGRLLVADLRQIREGWRDPIKARTDATVWPLIELLFRQAVLDSAIVQRELGVTAHNANQAIVTLESLGVLRKVSGNQRYRKWAAPEILGALDKFAVRAGRRQLPN
jgi:Fic family protein